jgi:hypothetical protein
MFKNFSAFYGPTRLYPESDELSTPTSHLIYVRRILIFMIRIIRHMTPCYVVLNSLHFQIPQFLHIQGQGVISSYVCLRITKGPTPQKLHTILYMHFLY